MSYQLFAARRVGLPVLFSALIWVCLWRLRRFQICDEHIYSCDTHWNHGVRGGIGLLARLRPRHCNDTSLLLRRLQVRVNLWLRTLPFAKQSCQPPSPFCVSLILACNLRYHNVGDADRLKDHAEVYMPDSLRYILLDEDTRTMLPHPLTYEEVRVYSNSVHGVADHPHYHEEHPCSRKTGAAKVRRFLS